MEEILLKQIQEIINTDEVSDKFNKYHMFMNMYNSAIKEVTTKFEILNDDLSVTHKRNPIEMIKSRIKSPQSILDKMNRKGVPITIESLLENINDVAGIRVICSFVDDIYQVANMLVSQDDITLLKVNDYIKDPKPNGYRSYHMIIEVPVFFSNSKRNMKVEVQLRTIAMDFWASLEHKMRYKKDIENADQITDELKYCADIIAQTDLRMQNINNSIVNLSKN